MNDHNSIEAVKKDAYPSVSIHTTALSAYIVNIVEVIDGWDFGSCDKFLCEFEFIDLFKYFSIIKPESNKKILLIPYFSIVLSCCVRLWNSNFASVPKARTVL
jgi:hypothetical protein